MLDNTSKSQNTQLYQGFNLDLWLKFAKKTSSNLANYLMKILLLLSIFSFFCLPTKAQQISDINILQSISKALKQNKNKNNIKIPTSIKDIEKNRKFNIKLATPKINQNLHKKKAKAFEMLEKQYYEIALKLYKKLYRDYPKQQDIQFSLAYIYHKLNRFEQAKKLYYKLINSSNKEIKSKSINNILIIVANQPNSNVDFILKKLSAENSENPYITSHLAIYYHERNKLNEAILLMRKAYNLQPSEISHKINLAILYDRNQQYKRASSIYQQIVDDYSQNKLSGDNIDIFKIKNRLEFIRKL